VVGKRACSDQGNAVDGYPQRTLWSSVVPHGPRRRVVSLVLEERQLVLCGVGAIGLMVSHELSPLSSLALLTHINCIDARWQAPCGAV
jgi:hypothetical protein